MQMTHYLMQSSNTQWSLAETNEAENFIYWCMLE